MSGDFGRYTAEELRDSGAVAVLLEPFRLEELACIVRRLAVHAARTALSCASLRRESKRITGVEAREATVHVEGSTDAVTQMWATGACGAGVPAREERISGCVERE